MHGIPDAKLLSQVWAGSLKWLLKHIFDQDLIDKLDKQMRGVIKKLEAAGENGLDYLDLIFNYALTGVAKEDRLKLELLLKTCLTEETGGKIMSSLAEHFLEEGLEKGRQEGIQKGRQKGRQEGLKKGRIEIAEALLLAKTPVPKVADFTKLSIPQVDVLAKKIRSNLTGLKKVKRRKESDSK